MKRTRQQRVPLETQLGLLAMRFRSTRDEKERAAIAGDYEHIVKQLIRSGQWEEMPAFEDMLPDEWMPEAFFTFWSLPSPQSHEDSEHAPLAIPVSYPLFVLIDGKMPVFVDSKEGNARVKALVVFTDRQAAEQYHDEHYPKSKVALLSDEESFARTLKLIRGLIALVAYYPSCGSKRMKTIPVDEMLRQLPDTQ